MVALGCVWSFPFVGNLGKAEEATQVQLKLAAGCHIADFNFARPYAAADFASSQPFEYRVQCTAIQQALRGV